MKYRRLDTLAVAAMASALVLASCTSEAPNKAGDGAGVDFGASKAEYATAFADVDPVKLVVQTMAPRGSYSGRKEEDYFKAVEEWSDGKITFDISYALAVAAANEVDDAIADGRLDMGVAFPISEPDQYPVHDMLLGASTLEASWMPVVGALQASGYLQDIAYNTPELTTEFEKAGMYPLVPFTMFVPQMLFCSKKKTTLAELDGTVSSANTTVIAEHLRALGSSPTSIVFSELFEALQRGAVDCVGSSLLQAGTSGLADPAPFAMYSGAASIGNGSGAFVVRKDTWESLPLVVRQLLFDRLDVYFDALLRSTWDSGSDTVEKLKGNGGGVFAFDDAVTSALQKQNSKTVEAWRGSKLVADPGALIELATSSADSWTERASEELGFEDSLDYADLPEWWAANKDTIDLKPYVDALFNDVLLEARPSK